MTHIIGERMPRSDAQKQVSGQAIYTEDLQRPDMLFAQVLRSPLPHAWITRLDVAAATRHPEVMAVITGEDVPNNRWGFSRIDQPVLCDSKVRYRGDAVAAVAATSPQAAREALDLIEIDYDPLPGVFDPLAALEADAPTIHGESNVAAHFKIRSGDIEIGWAESDEIIEETYRTQRIDHCYLEPHVSLAEIDTDGRLIVYTSTQRVFRLRFDLSHILQVPEEKIRVVSPAVGGGFGGKTEICIEPIVCLLALKSKRPVKLVYTRQDEFRASTIRHPFIIKLRSGVKCDGTLVARQVELIVDTGAYVSQGESVMTKAGIHAAGPYRIPHVKVDGYLVYTNTNIGSALRGFGVPQVAFAYESHTDTVAHTVGMDSLEFRMKNILTDNAILPTGQKLGCVALAKTIRAATRQANEDINSSEMKKRGRGIASIIYPIGATAHSNPSNVILKVNEDGSATLLTGTSEIGQGSTTALTQIASEELGIPFADIEVISSDTVLTPYDHGAGASRQTYIAGNAIRNAASLIREILFRIAADELGADNEMLDIGDGKIFLKVNPMHNISVRSVAEKAYQENHGLLPIAKGHHDPDVTALTPETGQGRPFATYVYATQIAEVEVDTETGQVEVLNVWAAHDIGKAINPMLVEGQIEGGISMGLGYALLEDLVIDEGNVLNPNFVDYVLPTASDIPNMQITLIEAPDPTGPYGAKGIGEPAMVPTAPAILNAIYDAVGIRIRDLPATPPKILAALETKRESASN